MVDGIHLHKAHGTQSASLENQESSGYIPAPCARCSRTAHALMEKEGMGPHASQDFFRARVNARLPMRS